MDNKTIKEVLKNDSIKITNRSVLLINEDKKSNKINNQVYLDIINTGLDDLENTYGDFDALHGIDEDVEFNKSVVREIIDIRRQLRFGSIDLIKPFTCNVINMAIDYHTEIVEDFSEEPCVRLQYLIQYVWGIKINKFLLNKMEVLNG